MNTKIIDLLNTIPKVDLTLDCIRDGTMGSIQADDPENPESICIHLADFWYLGGDPQTEWANEIILKIPTYDLIMSAATGWVEEIARVHGDRLQPYTRFSFSAVSLSKDALKSLFDTSPHKENILPIDSVNLDILLALTDSGFEYRQFGAPENFLDKGFGYIYKNEQTILGMAYTALVAQRGIEVSIWVAERQRQRGIATALASRLILECFDRGLEPHWDAANGESVKLAKKLRYTFTRAYDAYYIEKR